MRRLTSLLFILALAAPVPAHAGWPVFDYVGGAVSTLKAGYATVTANAQVIKTVKMLEEISALYQTYQNAVDMYASIGRVGRTVASFGSKFRQALQTWTRPITWQNLGGTLSAWGIQPDNSGPLGAANDMLKDYTSGIDKFSHDLAVAPRALGRDRFIRNVVRGAEADAEGKLNLTAIQDAEAGNAAADYAQGDLMQKLALQDEQRKAELQGLKEMSESMQEQSSDEETAALVLQHQTTTLTVKRSQVALQTYNQEASVAMADAIQRKAVADYWAYQRRRENTQAAIDAAYAR